MASNILEPIKQNFANFLILYRLAENIFMIIKNRFNLNLE